MRTAMMAMTTSNSINVNPRRAGFMGSPETLDQMARVCELGRRDHDPELCFPNEGFEKSGSCDASFRSRQLYRAGSIHGFEDGDEPRTEAESGLALHPDLDAGSEHGAARMGLRSG